MKKVLVTGANGHVGFNLVQELVTHGYSVRATVRDATERAKTAPLEALGAEVVSAELFDLPGLTRAMEGMDGLFQVAAVVQASPGNARHIIETATVGGLNALQAARAAGVKKVVLTSSVAAVGANRPGEPPRDEDDWDEGSRMPYIQAKVQGERLAREFCAAEGLELASVCPGNVVGPGFHRHTPVTFFVARLMANKVPLLPPGYNALVDVRDVAAGHRLAYEKGKPGGRYILATPMMALREIVRILNRLDPTVKVPPAAPGFLLPLLPAADWLLHVVSGAPHVLTRDFLREMGTREANYSTERARSELGWEARQVDQSLADTMEWMRGRELSTSHV